MTSRSLFLASLAALALAPPAAAQTVGTPGSEIVYLVRDCSAAGHTEGTDCFESIADLQEFLWDPLTGLHPDASDPVVVDVGAGDFVGPLECPSGAGWVTFRGVGRDRSRIVGPSSFTGFFQTWAVNVDGCESLGFQDLAVISEAGAGANYGVYWSGAGSSSWSDVDIRGTFNGWYDYDCDGDGGDPPSGEHHLYGVKVEAGSLGYYAECGLSWLYGSEVRVEATSGSLGPGFGYTGIAVAHRGDVRVYGSAVRVVGSDFPSASSAAGVRVGPSGNIPGTPDGSGTFHMHGGVVAVDASAEAGLDVFGLYVDDDGDSGHAIAHTPDTAFMVKGGTGADVARLGGDGHALSPFLWQSGAGEPVAGLLSQTGQDLYVETDCDASGDCSGSGNAPLQPHLMVYSANCTSRWFDQVTGSCRP